MRSKVIAVLVSLALIITASIVMTQTDKLPEFKDPNLLIRKTNRTLELYDGNKKIKTYKVVLGFDTKGDKEIEGDGRTPEGEFYVFAKNPESKFHLSLGISYPGIEDARRGLKEKLISLEEYDEIVAAIAEKRIPLQKTKLGGEIYIHGGGTDSDWTDGCIALKNEEMTELFDAIPIGAKVKVLP